jgi:hypothetical protein
MMRHHEQVNGYTKLNGYEEWEGQRIEDSPWVSLNSWRFKNPSLSTWPCVVRAWMSRARVPTVETRAFQLVCKRSPWILKSSIAVSRS